MQHAFSQRLFAALAFAVFLLLQATPAASQSTGQWQLGPNLPYFPVHMHLLPSGNVMMWPGDGVNGNDPRSWNPNTGAMTTLAKATIPDGRSYDLFCSGHNFLPDGRLFVTGGHISNGVGLAEASIYNPVNNTWTVQPYMNAGRWYPTNTLLPNGDVLVVSGDIDGSRGVNPLPQVWQAGNGQWRSLTNAQLQLPLYPNMFLAPNGRVFNAGPSVSTRYLDTAGTGAWTYVGDRTYFAMRDYGGAVMYEPGKILVVGGGSPPTNTAEVIDLNAATPVWRAVGSMSVARRQMSTTMLPDGKVLITGGTKGDVTNESTTGNPVFTTELWDPATGNFTPLANSGGIPRLYHSIAMLLPDARVLVTGGNTYRQAEIFSPPYLFAGARPTISDAPASVGKGQTLRVTTPEAANINAVSWVKLPSVTHTVDMNQAFFRSTSITRNTGSIDIVAPNLTTVTPGHYMLFLLQNGVPSVARIVQLTPTVNNPAPTLGSISPSSVTAGGAAFTLTVNGSNFINGSTVRWNGADRATTFVSGTQLTAAIPQTDVAAAGTAQVTVFNPSPGGGTSTALTFTVATVSTPNPAPTLGSISPSSVAAGGAAFTLTVNGSNFINGSTVRWNGADRATTFVSGTQLTAAIPQTDVAAAGTAQVTVFNPSPGGGTSTALTFTVAAATSNPLPTLSSTAPSTAIAGSEGFTLTVNGTGFVASSKVRWNNVDRATTVVSPTQLTAAIPASDIATAGTARVTVFSPTPGGGSSAEAVFTIRPLQNLTALGTIIAKVTAPHGGGSRDIEIVRNRILPPVGSTDSLQQYDTWDGANTAPDDWIGYQYGSAITFTRVMFQEGRHFFDGGWFTSLRVQVRQNGNWINVSNQTVDPAYPGINDQESFERYTFRFTPVDGDAIRVFGEPGGSADFISVGELEVYGSAGDRNITGQGQTIARVTAPQGGGSRNIEVIRDGVLPPVGKTDAHQQYDTWDGPNTAANDWIGYEYSAAQTFTRVMFQEGMNFSDGGWFTSLRVQVRQNGTWVDATNLTSTPGYPGINNGKNYETYMLRFTPITGDAIRIFGDPGGSADFISVGELEVYAQ